MSRDSGGPRGLAHEGLTLIYATVVQNTAGAGANLGFPTLASFGSMVALPQGGIANCSATGVSNGFNFSDDASCGFSAAETHPGVDPRLGPLANNGGTTLLQLPQSNRPLLDAIPVAHCSDDGASIITPLVDQRGDPRPQGSGVRHWRPLGASCRGSGHRHAPIRGVAGDRINCGELGILKTTWPRFALEGIGDSTRTSRAIGLFTGLLMTDRGVLAGAPRDRRVRAAIGFASVHGWNEA
jgi:hypothetical protein